MLDTLMVLWTRGVCARFLRSLFIFGILFVSICLLLFFVTNSDVKWPGLAFTAPLETSGPTPSVDKLQAVTPAAVALGIPIILQNPTAIPVTPRPVATFPVENRPLPVVRSKPVPVPSPRVRPTPRHEFFPTPETSDQPPMEDWFSNAVSANGHLSGSLVKSSSSLESLFWPALIATILTLGGCLFCFLLFRHKHRRQA